MEVVNWDAISAIATTAATAVALFLPFALSRLEQRRVRRSEQASRRILEQYIYRVSQLSERFETLIECGLGVDELSEARDISIEAELLGRVLETLMGFHFLSPVERFAAETARSLAIQLSSVSRLGAEQKGGEMAAAQPRLSQLKKLLILDN